MDKRITEGNPLIYKKSKKPKSPPTLYEPDKLPPNIRINKSFFIVK
jgi:hypothetical protein